MEGVTLWRVLHCGGCYIVEGVTLWRVLHCGGCYIVGDITEGMNKLMNKCGVRIFFQNTLLSYYPGNDGCLSRQATYTVGLSRQSRLSECPDNHTDIGLSGQSRLLTYSNNPECPTTQTFPCRPLRALPPGWSYQPAHWLWAWGTYTFTRLEVDKDY